MNGGRDDPEAWLRLWRAPGAGPRLFASVLAHYGDPATLLAAPGEWAAAGLPPEMREALGRVDPGVAEDLAWLERPGHHLIRLTDPAYPASLLEIPDPPPLLFVVGDPALLARPQIAMVGSRKATTGGVDNARAFARHLAADGLVITSGLALGIDSASHRGALEADGATVAVMGTGPDRLYPARHRPLAQEIAEHGALVTEFPTGVGVRREHFPRRNRLISGLGLGVLIVEAGMRSGSLVTARHALDQGREVFAIPGSIHNPMARGCHWLIRQGAKLVESAADVLEELPPLSLTETAAAAPVEPAAEALDEDYRRVVDALGYDPIPLDVLLQRTALTPDTLSSMLLLLELRGHVAACSGGRYARVRG